MNGMRISRLAAVFSFVAFVALLGAGLANAAPRDCTARFTLTSQVSWGAVTLPPGHYSFDLDITNDVITIRGRNRALVVMSLEHHEVNKLESSALILVSRAGMGTVRELQLKLDRRSLIFTYPVPKPNREELAKGPAVIERVPVAEVAN